MDKIAEFELLVRLQAMLSHQTGEENRRGHRPPLPPASTIRMTHRLAAESAKCQLSKGATFKNTLSNQIYASKTPFSHLKKANLCDLRLEMPAVGHYVIVRIIEEGYQVVGWNCVIEDEAGDVSGFSVYNYDPQELFSVGTVLIVKEPYFKVANQGFQFIRCDCPTDIIVLRPNHPLFHLAGQIEWKNDIESIHVDPLHSAPVPVTASQWKDRGNALYNKQQLILAREAYLTGLKICQESNEVLFKSLQINLAGVNLDLGYFEDVIKISDLILAKFPDDVKTLFRVGKANYHLRQYKAAFQYFEKLSLIQPNDAECQLELKRSRHRVKEMETGRISTKKLQLKSAKNRTKQIDCADYVGPIEIVKIPGKGRGVILTEDVSAGTILIISKALACVLDSQLTKGIHLEPNKMLDVSRNRSEIVSKLAQLVHKNPRTFAPIVYDLSDGSEQPPGTKVQFFCDSEAEHEPICDVERIKNVCLCNNFAIDYKSAGKFEAFGAGLFVGPSYLNHSCSPNVTRHFYNDIMVVRAAEALQCGVELCTNYVPVVYSFSQRSENIEKRGFKCLCQRCMQQI